MGGFLEIVPGCQGPWFLLEVDRSWASDDRQVSRVALRGFTDNQSNEALVKQAMTTKYATGTGRGVGR